MVKRVVQLRTRITRKLPVIALEPHKYELEAFWSSKHIVTCLFARVVHSRDSEVKQELFRPSRFEFVETGDPAHVAQETPHYHYLEWTKSLNETDFCFDL
jgi:hypothetical protein